MLVVVGSFEMTTSSQTWCLAWAKTPVEEEEPKTVENKRIVNRKRQETAHHMVVSVKREDVEELVPQDLNLKGLWKSLLIVDSGR